MAKLSLVIVGILTCFSLFPYSCLGECELQDSIIQVGAYFKFDMPPNRETFVFYLWDADKIQQARDIIAGRTTEGAHVMGTIVKTPVHYNSPWSFHLDSNSIEFFEFAVEVCDAGIGYIEDHFEEVGGSFLPGNKWCPWASRLIEEVKPLKPFYRLYNPTYGDHFYTMSAAERDYAIQRAGYIYEGIAGYLYVEPPLNIGHIVPLYRLYNPVLGDHFYTMSDQERDFAVKSVGYIYEGIVGYLYSSRQSDIYPFYRLYNPVSGDHFYTMSAAERDYAIQRAGYTYEGIAGYLYN